MKMRMTGRLSGFRRMHLLASKILEMGTLVKRIGQNQFFWCQFAHETGSPAIVMTRTICRCAMPYDVMAPSVARLIVGRHHHANIVALV